MIASTAHIATLSFKSRLQPGSANTTAPVPLRREPAQAALTISTSLTVVAAR